MKPTQRMKLFKDDIDFSRAIIEMTQEVIVLLDTEGRIMDCNVFMEKLSGYSAGEIIGRNWHDTLEFMGGTAITQKYYRKTIARKKIPRTEVYRLISQSGEPLYLEFNFRVIKDTDSEFTGVLVVGYDVTGRVQHEQDLEEERFDLIERNKELTCLYNVANLANDQKLSLADMLQSTSEIIPEALQYPEIAGARIRLDNRTYTSEGFRLSDLRILEPITIQNIGRGDLEIVYTPDPETAASGAIGFLAEERHLAEAVAGNLALIIEKREADERKIELEQQLRHAERLATIGQLAAGVAHELNEPLGNILGFAQLAGRDDGLPDQLYKDLDKIVKSALHAREIIKKLMLFGRRMPRQEKAISLNKIVEDGLYFLEARCVKSGIVVHKQTDDGLPMVDADPSQLEQVLVNLVINAIQAMDQGGELTIRTYARHGHVHLAVGDTGPGIADEIIAQIFVPFFTTKDVNEGTGLGLSVVHGIVMGHNGRIDVDTQVGRGTTFTISIPLTQE